MKLKVSPHKIKIEEEEITNEKEIKISDITFDFDEEITDDYVKEAYFTNEDGRTYKVLIQDDKCNYPQEVLETIGNIEIGVVAYLVENEEEIKRYNPTPISKFIEYGSLKDAENTEPITPSEMEQFEQALENGLNEVANVDIDAEQTETGGTITITNRYGQEKEVNILNGAKGDRGDTGSPGPQGEQGRPGEPGQPGEDGFSPSASVSKTGKISTLTVTDKNGTTSVQIKDGEDGGVSDYEDLTNKPSINNVELSGNLSLQELGIDQNFVKDNNYVHTDNNYTTTEKNKLEGLSNYDDTQIKSDINNLQTNKADKSEIPTIPENLSDFNNDVGYITNYTETDPIFNNSVASTITNNDITNWNGKQSELVSGTNIKTINNQSILGSGNINISGGGGSSTDVQINGTSITDSGTANIITKGIYNSSTNKIATESDIPDTSNFITKDVNNLTNYTKTNDLSTVAITGSYNDLSNTPTIPDELSDLSDDSTHRVVTDTQINTWNNKSDFSGSYNDLTNKPTIPTATSDLTNDSGYLTSESDPVFSASASASITNSDITNWNNKGTYSKPSGGIPSTDLASAVQTSLGKADASLQTSLIEEKDMIVTYTDSTTETIKLVVYK